MSAAKEKSQTGQSGIGAEYEAVATRARHEDARETRDGTNCRGLETTGPRESSGVGEEGATDLRDVEEHHSNPAANCVKELAPAPSSGEQMNKRVAEEQRPRTKPRAEARKM
jgi:hypothetical protein